MAQITDNGYVLKTQNEWFEEEEQKYLDIDPDWNLDPSTPDGLKLASDSEIFANLDELGLKAYNSKDPNKASGTELDIICALTGTVRSPGTPSTALLTLSGDQGTVITAGAVVESTENGARWTTDSTVTIGVSGSINVAASCENVGPTQASIDTLTKIVNPVSGWQGVTNAAVATPGTSKETDAELRYRRKASVSLPGNNQVDSMFSAIAAVDGVRRVKIYENDTDAIDTDGLPAHSIAPIIDGGTDADVARAIYNKKNPGVTLDQPGTAVDVVVTSPVTGNPKTIKFSRPIYVDIAVTVNVTDDGSLPVTADQEIEDAILEYVDGTLLESVEGFNQTGFDIGESAPPGRLYTPVNKVLGLYGSSFVSSILLDGGSTTIAIDFNELARFTGANITVNIT